MKLAVFHNLPSGGAKRALYGLVKRLSLRGSAVDVFTPSTSDDAFLDLRPVVRKVTVAPVRTTAWGVARSALRYLPPRVPFSVSFADLEDAHRRLAGQIDEGDYDVAFVEQDRYTVSPFALKFLAAPSVYSCQQPCRMRESVASAAALRRIPAGWSRRARVLLERYIASRLVAIDRQNAAFARAILANSHFSRETIRQAYGRDASVCYLGIDAETFRPLAHPRDDAVLSVGYLGPLKGHDFIVAALGLIPERLRPRLVIVANAVDASWRGHVERLAAVAGVRLDVRSAIADPELVALYNISKLFVYAAHLEPFGLAPVEAMACGTPVVAVGEGGVRETVVDGETGLLSERREATFADAVAGLLADDRRRARMAERAIATVRTFWSMEQATDRLVEHLRRAARDQRRPASSPGEPRMAGARPVP